MIELDFGFVFSRVLRGYGLGYWELMSLPIRAFWLLHRNLDRVTAEEDLRAMTGAICALNGDAYREQAAGLRERIGQVVLTIDTTYDRQGLLELKDLANSMKG
ncbi:hypothetical protein [Azospirillum sp.]|uniref:hypothetical protein n=1 Tax=Azospirillum sp. TaxID=34012 RepID=UPI003D730F69